MTSVDLISTSSYINKKATREASNKASARNNSQVSDVAQKMLPSLELYNNIGRHNSPPRFIDPKLQVEKSAVCAVGT